MFRKFIIILFLIVLAQPVSSAYSLVSIKPGTLDNQTEGFVLMYPLENTIQPGEVVTFRNDDLHRRHFTLVSEEGLFNETTLNFRQSLEYQFNDSGMYNFHLMEKPTVKLQLTVSGNDSTATPQKTPDIPEVAQTPEEKYQWTNLVEKIPGFGAVAAFILLIVAFLAISIRRQETAR